jgi:tetratricopeptide (TPR) repeat protein
LRRRRRTIEAIKAVLLRESEVQPLVIVFEDLHWVNSETQAFLDSLVESLPTARVLLLVNYRPEYQHGWASRSYYTQRRIQPLPPQSAGELLRELLGDSPSLARLKELLLKGGNPFFLEETVRTLVETGSLEGARGLYRLVRPLQALQIPPTVQAILTARIDRLPPEDKQLLQAASVVGKDVPYVVLQAIAGLPAGALQRRLADLQEHEFLYEARLFPDREYTFKHALTHEVTYGSLLAERRRALHKHILEATLRLYPDRSAEHVERLAHHAVRGELWEQAVSYLRQAGTKAAARSAYREAAAGFEQALIALGHLPETQDTLRQGIDIRFELRSSLQALNEHERVIEHLREVEKLAAALEDRARLGWASAYLSQYLWRTGEPQQAEERSRRALAVAAEIDDLALQAVAGLFPGQGYFIIGDYGRATDHCRRNVATIKRELTYERLGLTGLPSVLSRIWLAWALAERGEFAEAMKHARDALSVAEAADQPYSMAAACLGIGEVHLVQGALEQAVPVLERAIGVCENWGLLVIHPTAASALGLAYALCGRLAEGLPILEEAEARTPAVRIFDASTARTALCTGYLLSGRLDEATEIALRGVALAAGHGYRGIQARAWCVLGEIAARRDSPELAPAEGHYCRSLTSAEELGMHPLVAHCRLGLGRLYRRVGEHRKAEEQVTIALAMYRDMGMGFWLEKAESYLSLH